MRVLVGVAAIVALLLAAGCNDAPRFDLTGYGDACSTEADCAIFGLDICTTGYGDPLGAAFCTRTCDDGSPNGDKHAKPCPADNTCSVVFWRARGGHQPVCVPDAFLAAYR